MMAAATDFIDGKFVVGDTLLNMRYVLLVCSFLVLLNPSLGQTRKTEAEQIETERRPNPDKLFQLVNSADRIAVFASEGGEEEKKIYESSKPIDVAGFREAFKIVIPEGWKMSICPTPRVVLYQGDKEIGWIANVNGVEVRTSVWGGNADIANSDKWVDWFEQRGMPQVRKERDELIAHEKKSEADRARFYAAMPRGVSDLFERQLGLMGLPSQNHVKPFLPVLEKEYPNLNERILTVAAWYGSGSGEWDSTTSHESIVETLLLEYPTEAIVRALKSRELNETEIEGSARFFAGWNFSRVRPADIKLISAPLKKKFLDHSLKGTDQGKISLARKAFGSD